MSGPYHYRKHHFENSLDSSVDDGSKRVQTFGGHQDDSVLQHHQDPTQQRYHQHYPEQNLHQQLCQQSYQNSVQDQSRLMRPAQHQSRHPDQYTAQRQTQQLHDYPIQDTDEYPHEFSEDFRRPDRGQNSCGKSVEFTIEQPHEDSNRYLYPVPNAHRAYRSYLTEVTAPVTGALGSPRLTSMDSQPGPSQANATVQAEGTWIRSHGLPASPDSISNSFNPVEETVTEYERPAQWAESTLSPSQEQELREGIARGDHLDEMARRANRPAQLIQHFIASNSLMWTELQDGELVALVDQGCNTPAILDGLGHLGGPRRFDYEVEARARYLLPDGGSAQRADMAGNLLHDFHQSPVVCEPDNSVSPYPNQQVGSKTRSAPELWGDDEVKRLEDSVPRNNYIWGDIKKEFPGRSVGAVRNKWSRLHGLDQVAYHRHQWRDDDDEKLSYEIARGLSCAKVARMWFRSLPYKQVLHRAAVIQAFWTKEDDVKLFGMDLKPHPGFDWNSIGRKYVPERKGHLVKKRWEFLQRGVRGEDIEEEYDEQPQDYTTQGTHFELPGHPGDGPNYLDAELPALFPGSVDQNFEYPGADSAQTDPNDQQYYHQNIQENASGYPEDGLDYLNADQFLSSSGEPDWGSMDLDTISAAGIWNDYSNTPMEPDVFQDMDMSTKAFFEGQKYSNHGIQPSFAGHTIAASNYPSTGPSPIRSAVATQSLTNISTGSAPSYDSVREMHQPTPPNEPHTPVHGPSYASREESAGALDSTGKLTEEIIPEIKRRLAEGWEWREVNAVYFPGSNYSI